MRGGSARRRAKDAEEEPDVTERWTVSYMDMVTVMMCLFIVLFAISQVDQDRLQTLADSLGAALGSEASTVTVVTGGDGVLTDQAPSEGEGLDSSPGITGVEDADTAQENAQKKTEEETRAEAQAEVDEMGRLRSALQSDLAASGLADAVSFTMTEHGLVIGLVTQDVFFEARSAELSGTTQQVVDVVARRLAGLDNDLVIEGYANTYQDTQPYPTNWELSADRSVKVLRRMVEADGIDPARISAAAFGDAHPVADPKADPVAANRRVDIVVETKASAAVREEIAKILASAGEE
jgi:chemotaxis protein MotB